MVLFMGNRLARQKIFMQLWSSKNCKNKGINSTKFSSKSSADDTKVTCFNNGKSITFSTGKFARFADGCATAQLGDTSVMVTAVSSTHASNGIPLPLTRNWAIDDDYDPDVLSINAASAALSVSDIPWNGPVGAVRVGLIDKNLVINPTRREIQQSALNLIVTAIDRNLTVMLEGVSDNVATPDICKAIKHGVKECQFIVKAIQDLQKACGKSKREFVPDTTEIENVMESVKQLSQNKLREIFLDYKHDKISRDKAIGALREEVIAKLLEKCETINTAAVIKAFGETSKQTFRTLVFENNRRCDGRTLEELRPINCSVQLFKPLHGSAMFQRGQTQVLCTVTLDCIESALKSDMVSMLISGVKEKNFFLHYEFPPYATNETKSIGRTDRREIGHGALAEKGLRAIIPKEYPFTIRLTSEVLESNGSSSMASICGGSLALLDAGVPILAPAAGVAIGLMTKYSEADKKTIEDYRILTDILGIEDYLGDMDFKIAGTKKGITSLQADVKVPGLPLKIVMESIKHAIQAKQKILEIMHRVISAPQQNKTNMPVLESLTVLPNQRGKFLGAGGANVKKIFVQTGVNIYPQDETTYNIFAPNQNAMNEAKEIIEEIMKRDREPTLEFGGIYTARIVEIRESGVMVTLYPSMIPVLLPNSQLDQRRVLHPNALGLEVGQDLQVKYFGRDPVSGQVRLSRKVLQEPVTTFRNLISES
ncbi:hypothetical protein KM043_000600 [Ampulex compressa]|nr:hypothetical protein KM043_000600 [Ampulex compressa]